MPNGTSAPGKSSAEFVVPMKGLTYEAGSVTREVMEIGVRVAAEAAGASAVPRPSASAAVTGIAVRIRALRLTEFRCVGRSVGMRVVSQEI
jgi:hypothetical protein